MSGDGDAGQPPAAPPEPQRRLSPLTILTEPVGYLKGLVLPLGAALVAGGRLEIWIVVGSLATVALMLLAGLGSYWSVRYQIGAERFELRKGIVRRSWRTIPLERIRGVDVSAPPLHRLLGLAVVKIEAAAGGGAPEEGKLDAVRLDEAQRLQRELLRRRELLGGEPSAAQDGQADTGAGELVYFEMPRRWYLYGALSPRYLAALLVALAALGGAAIELLVDLGVDLDQAVDRVRALVSGDAGGLAAALGIAAALLLTPIAAVIAYVVAQWRFSLRRRGECLVTERGLLTRRQVSLEHRRVRGYELADDPLARLAGAVRVEAIAAGIAGGAARAALLPTGPRKRVQPIVAEALTPYAGALRPHPPAARRRRLARAVVPVAAAAIAAALLQQIWLAGALAVAALLSVPLGFDRYRSLGHGHDGQQISVRSGSLRREQAVVQRRAIIGWRWSQTPLQRRVGLGTLEVAVGAGKGRYAAIDIGMSDSVAFAQEVTPELVAPFVVRD